MKTCGECYYWKKIGPISVLPDKDDEGECLVDLPFWVEDKLELRTIKVSDKHANRCDCFKKY